jgi:medium-chain acyl-[acyl-carrier-protein] hydrolase
MVTETKELAHPAGINPQSIWIEDYKIRFYEVDRYKKVTIQTLCNYIQESAANHIFSLGVGLPHLNAEKRTWILSRLLIRIHKLPKHGDQIKLKTWQVGVKKLFALRDFSLVDRYDDRVADATSCWLVINIEKRIPERCDAYVDKMMPVAHMRAIDAMPSKIPSFCGFEYISSTTVRKSDLDMNRHVNNVKYIEWLFEGLPDPVFQNLKMTLLEINYLNETNYGDTIEIHTRRFENEQNTFIHRFINKTIEKEVCLAKSKWEKRMVE